MIYESTAIVESQVASGVKFTVAKMSFGRRTELLRELREMARKIEFLEAGKDSGQKMDGGAATGRTRPSLCEVGFAGGFGPGVGWNGGHAGIAGGRRAGGSVPGGRSNRAGADWAKRPRTKKLIVAFHFEFSNQAGWKCDVCRKVRPGKKAALRMASRRTDRT